MISLPILIPQGFSNLVKIGDNVSVGQVLAQKAAEIEEKINIAKKFSIPLGKVHKVLKKKPGNAVAKGDIIAVKKSLFGIKKQSLISNISGTIIRYERETGDLVIKTSFSTTTENIISPVDGIVSLCDNEQIVINTEKNILTANKGTGKNAEGEMFILDCENANVLYYLDARATGKVIVGGDITKDILIKGAGLEAVGFIGTNITDDIITYMTEKNLHIPILELEHDIIQRLIQWQGKRVYMEGDSKTIILLQT